MNGIVQPNDDPSAAEAGLTAEHSKPCSAAPTETPLPGLVSAAVGAEQAAHMALAALCALVHCPVQPATSTPIVEHFPLGQALSLRVTESTDKVGTCHAVLHLHGSGGKAA